MNPPKAPRTFDEPWQARAFALAVQLHEQGVFAWSDFTKALGAEIAAGDDADGAHYCEHWLAALERVLAES